MDKDLLAGALNNNAPNVNPFDYPSEQCICGNEVFVPGIIFKKIPGILLGKGTDYVQLPLKVFCCSKCGELSPYDKKILEEEEKLKDTVNNANKTNLII